MSTAFETATLPATKGHAQFAVKTGKTPVAIVQEPGSDSAAGRYSGTFKDHEINIYDGRPIASQLDLDRHGFKLMRYPTAVQNFYDDEEVRRLYYPEMDKLVKQVTGAAKVVIFDHTVRIDDPEQQQARHVRGPATIMHNDFTERSAVQRVKDLLPEAEAAECLKKRFGSINVWRPIIGPVETAPIAICEYDSIAKEDLIAAERRYKDRVGGVYHLVHNPAQRWYYFPQMEREEVLILKCYDSQTDGTARWTAHGSFEDPATPPGALPRESIEIRTLYFYD